MQEITIKKSLRMIKQLVFDWAVLENSVYWLYEIQEDWY